MTIAIKARYRACPSEPKTDSPQLIGITVEAARFEELLKHSYHELVSPSSPSGKHAKAFAVHAHVLRTCGEGDPLVTQVLADIFTRLGVLPLTRCFRCDELPNHTSLCKLDDAAVVLRSL
eukprot:1873564-Amphidinium_carterae.1